MDTDKGQRALKILTARITLRGMGKKASPPKQAIPEAQPHAPKAGKPSALLDTRVVYCGLRRAQSSRDNLEQLAKPALSLPNGLPDGCVDLTGGSTSIRLR